ncbi:hypothetical protein PENSUB_6618 [Penicillium subrubescens]|uniref:Uncharacterized protein n=1 Tax=Penicillium subrubescens TaxID=1316194 RepID=A0A1Q5U098_9EURO|nr:hypothetical protein PENSUB_6618 [Penicillium subrubescens]
MSLFVISSKEIQDLKEAEIVEFEPKDDIQEELDFLRQDEMVRCIQREEKAYALIKFVRSQF